MSDKRPKLPPSSSSSKIKAPPSMAAPRSMAEATAMSRSPSSRTQTPSLRAPGSVMPSRLDRVPGSVMPSRLDKASLTSTSKVNAPRSRAPGSVMPSKLDRANSMAAPRSVAEANALNQSSSYKIKAPPSVRGPLSLALSSTMPSRLDRNPLSTMPSQLDRALPSGLGRSNMPSKLDQPTSRVTSPPSTMPSAPPSFIAPPSTPFPSTAGRSVIPSAASRDIAPTARSTLTTQHDQQMAARQMQINTLTREERIKQEEWAMRQLSMSSNRCPMGFTWARKDELKGYRCQPFGTDGTHLITDELLAEGRARFFTIGLMGWDAAGNEIICGPFSSNEEWEEWMAAFLLSLSHQAKRDYSLYRMKLADAARTQWQANQGIRGRLSMGGGGFAISGGRQQYFHQHHQYHQYHQHHQHHYHRCGLHYEDDDEDY